MSTANDSVPMDEARQEALEELQRATAALAAAQAEHVALASRCADAIAKYIEAARRCGNTAAQLHGAALNLT